MACWSRELVHDASIPSGSSHAGVGLCLASKMQVGDGANLLRALAAVFDEVPVQVGGVDGHVVLGLSMPTPRGALEMRSPWRFSSERLLQITIRLDISWWRWFWPRFVVLPRTEFKV